MQPMLVSYPFELVHLDFLTLGGKTDDSKSVNVLIVTDCFTKYAQAYVIPKLTTVIAAKTLWENFWCIMDGLRRFLLTKVNLLRIT